MDCSPPGSSVHGISQARILEWVAISLGDLPNSGIESSPALASGFFITEPPGKPSVSLKPGPRQWHPAERAEETLKHWFPKLEKPDAAEKWGSRKRPCGPWQQNTLGKRPGKLPGKHLGTVTPGCQQGSGKSWSQIHPRPMTDISRRSGGKIGLCFLLSARNQEFA